MRLFFPTSRRNGYTANPVRGTARHPAQSCAGQLRRMDFAGRCAICGVRTGGLSPGRQLRPAGVTSCQARRSIPFPFSFTNNNLLRSIFKYLCLISGAL